MRPLSCWDCGFESRRGHRCLSLCECYLFSGIGLCDGPILRRRESYRVCRYVCVVCVCVCLSLNGIRCCSNPLHLQLVGRKGHKVFFYTGVLWTSLKFLSSELLWSFCHPNFFKVCHPNFFEVCHPNFFEVSVIRTSLKFLSSELLWSFCHPNFFEFSVIRTSLKFVIRTSLKFLSSELLRSFWHPNFFKVCHPNFFEVSVIRTSSKFL